MDLNVYYIFTSGTLTRAMPERIGKGRGRGRGKQIKA
jgi:hypothetical protein